MKCFSEISTPLKGTVIFLDIDGTLCGDGERCPYPDALKKLKVLAKDNEIYLCSNGTDTLRNRSMGKLCGVPYLDTPLRKPCRDIGDLVENKKKKPLVVIGNLYATDGRFAKNIGARFIKVKTILGPDEGLLHRLVYWFDENIIARFV